MSDSFSTLRSIVVSYFYSFKESFLFYPIIFTIGGFALFMMTSRLDEIYGSSFYDDNNIIVSYLEPVFFAGSPHAARSVLSTIAAGWATILGVAFSVTLITLQLSVTKYTPEIINEFQNSRINQLTLALFILVVTFSLLVLKTVRTGEDGSSTFTPILGVNISVYLAVIVLFVFVIFLHNISSYLKPDSLISNIVKKVLQSTKRYEKRMPSRQFTLDIQNKGKKRELLEIRSPRQGIVRSMDWDKVSDQLEKHPHLKKLEHEQPSLFLEWLLATGDHVEKGEIISKLYSLENVQPDSLHSDKKIVELVQSAVFASLDIGPARRISSDPHYGLEILRNMAVRGISQSDIGIASSCITGLFRIFYKTAEAGQSAAAPFTVPINSRDKFVATISTGEGDIPKQALAQLSLIYNVSSMSNECRASLATLFAKSYASFGRLLLDRDNTAKFEELTEWYSRQSLHAMPSYPEDLKITLKDILEQFRQDVKINYPYGTDIVRIHLARIFAAQA